MLLQRLNRSVCIALDCCGRYLFVLPKLVARCTQTLTC